MEFIWVFVGGLVLYAIISAMTTAPGRSLQGKFVGMGTLAGKTKDEIIAVVGSPNSISGLPNGKILLQWQATGYHIALRFNGDTCEGIIHQFASR